MPYLGAIPFDSDLEAALGNVALLRETAIYGALGELAQSLG